MPLSNEQEKEISSLLELKIKAKLENYNPEPNNMPFHIRLLGVDRMAIFPFIQSINTMLGTSIFEQIAAIIARPHFKQVAHQFKEFNNTLSRESQAVIQEIIDSLTSFKSLPNKATETSKILSVSQTNNMLTVKRPRIDLFIKAHDGTEYYFDLKTAKPNIGELKGYKRTLLEWVAIRGALDKDIKIHTMLAIPYNPYEPEPYQRWTFQGMFDLKNEILVADEFWNFIGGNDTYINLLKVFEDVGIKLRPEIDARFALFRE